MTDFLHTLKKVCQHIKNIDTRTQIVINSLNDHDGVTRGIYQLNGNIEILRQNQQAIPLIEKEVNRLWELHQQREVRV